MSFERMSDYEKRAWERIEQWREEKLGPPAEGLAGRAAGRVREAATGAWARVPRSAQIEQALFAAIEGMHEQVTDLAMRSVSIEAVIGTFQRAGHDVFELGDLFGLDLEDIDAVAPPLRRRYAWTFAGEGAALGAAAGSAALFAATSARIGALPGVAGAAVAVAADVLALLAGSARAVAHHAAYHGFDTREPGERAFALAVMSAAATSRRSGRRAAFDELSRLTGLLPRDTVRDRLESEAFRRLVQRTFVRLARRLTRRKLASAVPVAGGAVGAALNYHYMSEVCEAAWWLYRERFLMQKHGLATGIDGHSRRSDVVEIDRIRMPPDEDGEGAR